jgi:hypothetical protein
VTIAAVEMGVERPLMADIVEKVFLRQGTQVLRAVGAMID